MEIELVGETASDEDWKTFESALKETPRNLTEFMIDPRDI